MFRLSVYLIGVLFLVLCLAPASAFSADGILRKAPIETLPQWQRVLRHDTIEKSSRQSKQYQNWQQFTASLRGEPKLRQMMRVDLWFKKFPQKIDSWAYGSEDYWASPAEFLARGGDCEDYAIIKYMTLKQLGFHPKDMRIAMVYDVYSGTDHAYLIVTHDGVDYVLDNREKMTVARFMEKRYRMHFTFNELGVWVYNKPVMAHNIRNSDNGRIIPGNR